MKILTIIASSVVTVGLWACGGSDDSDTNQTEVTGDGGPGGASSGGSGATAGIGGASTGGSGVTSGGSAGAPQGGANNQGGAPAGGAGGGSAGADSGAVNPPPSDGTQLAACQSDADCDPGLACYTFGGYCSAVCGGDADCAGLTGATYTCFVQGGGGPGPTDGGTSGICRVDCTGLDDTTSCPDGLSCVEIGFGGIFRCAYQEPAGGDAGGSGTTPAFGECQSDGDCAAGLSCTAFNGGTGYCTQSCQAPGDCTEQPSTGSVTASCSGFGLCTLDCAGDAGTCPDGMECQTFGGGGGFAFCNYP